MQAKIASINCKQKLQAEISSRNCKQKLQAQWTKKQKFSFFLFYNFFYQNQPMTQPSAGKNTNFCRANQSGKKVFYFDLSRANSLSRLVRDFWNIHYDTKWYRAHLSQDWTGVLRIGRSSTATLPTGKCLGGRKEGTKDEVWSTAAAAAEATTLNLCRGRRVSSRPCKTRSC